MTCGHTQGAAWTEHPIWRPALKGASVEGAGVVGAWEQHIGLWMTWKCNGRTADNDQERRKIRRQHRWDLVSMLVAGLLVVIGTAAVLVVSWRYGMAELPEPLSGRYFAEWYHVVAGRLSPNTAFNAVLAGAGLCATINVALAVEDRVTDGRGLVALSAWQESLERAAWLVCVGVVGMGMAVWANLDSPRAVGTALVTSLFAVVTAYLVVSIRRHVNAADQINRCARAVQQLAMLDVRDRELEARGVPRPLGVLGVASMLNTRAVWSGRLFRRCLWACGWRLLALALVEIMYFVLVAGTFVAVRLLTHASVKLSWTGNDTLFVLGLAVLAISVGLVLFGGVAWRWVPPAPGRTRRRQHGRLDDSRAFTPSALETTADRCGGLADACR